MTSGVKKIGDLSAAISGDGACVTLLFACEDGSVVPLSVSTQKASQLVREIEARIDEASSRLLISRRLAS